jgi:hypothetical protein
MTQPLADSWRAGTVKALERENAAMALAALARS